MSDRPHPVLGVPAEEVTPGVWVALRRHGQQWLYWIDVGIGYAGAVRTPGRAEAVRVARLAGQEQLMEYVAVLVSQETWPTCG